MFESCSISTSGIYERGWKFPKTLGKKLLAACKEIILKLDIVLITSYEAYNKLYWQYLESNHSYMSNFYYKRMREFKKLIEIEVL